VVVVGSINVDRVIRVPRLPGPGETVLGTALERHYGGKGANQAVAAARAGADVVMLGSVGRDADGDASLAALRTEGVDVSHMRRSRAPTGAAMLAVGPDGENQIVVAPGANRSLSASQADLERADVTGDVLLASLEVPMAAVSAAVASAVRLGMRAILVPAPARRLPASVLAQRPILVPNEHELTASLGAVGADAAMDRLERDRIAAVVTLGAAGCLVLDGGLRTAIAGRSLARAVDTTGAGDTFAGVLAAWLAGGHSLLEGAHAATAAATLSIGRRGPREGMPMRSAIEEVLAGQDEVQT
jgi:ribokinase